MYETLSPHTFNSMDCFEYSSLVQVNVPHHSHRRVLGSYVVKYRTIKVPASDHMFKEFEALLLDACDRVGAEEDDLLRVSLKSEAKDPITVHCYYHRKSSDEFINEINNFATQVYKVCQSTRCFVVGRSVQVLIDRIAAPAQPSGSSCSTNSYVIMKGVNKYIPLVESPSDPVTKGYSLPNGSSKLEAEVYTFSSDSDCLFLCLFVEVVRKRKDHFFRNFADPEGILGTFPFKCNRKILGKWMREVKEGRKEQINELQGAARAFARILNFSHLIGQPLTTQHFLQITNQLTRFTGLRFILYNQSLSPIASTNNYKSVPVHIMLHDNHYRIISSIKCIGRRLCRFCLYYRNENHRHNCRKICYICKTTECLDIGITKSDLKCEECKIFFRNELCKGKHTCKYNSNCYHCKKRLINCDGVRHICRFYNCRICGAVDTCIDHMCSFTSSPSSKRKQIYESTCRIERNEPAVFDMAAEEVRISGEAELQPLPPFDVKKTTILIYYDIETATMPPGETQAIYPVDSKCNVLVPIVVCAQTECHDCVQGKHTCACGQKRWTFVSSETLSCMKSFVLELHSYIQDDSKHLYKLIAHNGGRFDHHFLMRAVASYGPTPDLFITRGSTIIGMRWNNVDILDSFKFIQTSLRSMPKAIGADIEASKDYFPHSLTTWLALKNGLNCLPDKTAFNYDKMTRKEQDDFDTWFAAQEKESHYDFLGKMVEYCHKDVEVLRLCCRKFICNWYLRFGFNPFEAYTLPSTVIQSMIVKSTLAPLIPLTPYHGYGKAKTESQLAKAYLNYLGDKMGVTFERGKMLNPKFYPDGYTDTPRKIAVDFLGCYYHLCEECGFNTHRENFYTKSVYKLPSGQKMTINEPITKEVEESRRLMKRAYCEEYGIEYIEIWEHELYSLSLEEKRKFELFHQYVKQQSPEPSQIVHREALFGGRTEAFKLYHECADDEVIEYHDVNGLYPHVLMEGRFPLMDPTFIYRISDAEAFLHSLSADPLIKKAALCKAQVTAPSDLQIPVLPCRVDGKLKFGLCNQCMIDSSPQCDHDEYHRQLTGTWTSFELELAIKHGYRINFIIVAEVYELCAGPETPGLPNPHREFIGKCMAAKDYAEQTGNKSARYLAKLAANTYWGAMAKNADNLSIKFFTSVDDFYDFLNKESIQIKDLHSLGTKLKLTYRTLSEMIETPKRTSLITAIFVTSQARIKLYNYMHQIGSERVIYCDTDSVLWIRKKYETVPFTVGSLCGQMSNEIEKDYPNSHISRFVSLGPKSYAYDVHNNLSGERVSSAMRMKGISFSGLNSGTSLTFEDMRSLLFKTIESIQLQQTKFSISNHFHTLHFDQFNKIVRVTMDKRVVVLPHYSTHPFGLVTDSINSDSLE